MNISHSGEVTALNLRTLPVGNVTAVATPRPKMALPRESAADVHRFLASLPAAPVVSLDSLDRGEIYR